MSEHVRWTPGGIVDAATIVGINERPVFGVGEREVTLAGRRSPKLAPVGREAPVGTREVVLV